MLKNYLTVAWRNITRHKVYAAINIMGLAIGIAACLLILQYVGFELSYEKFQVNKDRIYRVQQDRYNDGKLTTRWAAGAFAPGNSFKDRIPEIETYVKLVQTGQPTVEVDHQPLKIDQIFYASQDFFSVFSFPLIAGNGKTALQEPMKAAIAASTARKIFGTTDVLGKTITLNRQSHYMITGVYEDAPVNTQIRPGMLLSYATFVQRNTDSSGNGPENAWQWDGCLTYLLLKPGADPKKVEAKFVPIVEQLAGADMKQSNAAAVYHLQPLKDIHLTSHYMMEPGETAEGKTVYLLLGIAFFIVVIAWVNYINLATARAINRAREVGVRKAVGSSRRDLIIQFLSESALLNGIAVLLAIGIVLVALPGFTALSGQQMSRSLFVQKDIWINLGGLFITGVFLSGLYPAFVLSGFNPVEVLKGKSGKTTHGAVLRKSLVVFQFAASLFLLIGTVTVYRQISFMRNQSLGLNIDQTLVIAGPSVGVDSTHLQKMKTFKEALAKQTAVKSIAVSTNVPGEAVGWNAGGIKLVNEDITRQKQYRIIGMDYDYISTYGLKVIAGRAFSPDFGNDKSNVIFNEKAVQQLGFNKAADALNKKIDFWGKQYTIVGVVANFHQQSLREDYDALIFRCIPDVAGYISIKTTAAGAKATIEAAKAQWSSIFAGNVFSYFFIDDHFNEQYKTDQRFGQVFGLFTGLAILVACLGLFGLASFTTLQRTKEIGIRKVLGASVASILQLLYREFALLLLIAFVLAIPLAWWTVDTWLHGYAFRTQLHWGFFVLPFVSITAIAFIAVGFQSIKAALSNPVRALHTE